MGVSSIEGVWTLRHGFGAHRTGTGHWVQPRCAVSFFCARLPLPVSAHAKPRLGWLQWLMGNRDSGQVEWRAARVG
jgi:hypothetical protein